MNSIILSKVLRITGYSLSLHLLTVVPGLAQARTFINTERTLLAATVTYPSTAVVTKNAVDGYVKMNGTTKFLFPTADNGMYRPFAAAANGTSGAYYRADPSIAITSKPKGGNYGPLPAPGPFNTAMKNTDVGTVSNKEYWDINGALSTKITLTWDAASDVNGLLGSRGLSNLIVVGWDGAKWVKIQSTLDETSVFGELSTATSGSITTTAILPRSYSVYTLAATPSSSARMASTDLAVTGDEQKVDINWTTDVTENLLEFEVEKSEDGNNWIQLNKIAFTDQGEGRYSSQDLYPSKGLNSYRIKIVKNDGTSFYSKPSSLKIKAEFETAVYPNPARDLFFLRTDNLKQVVVYDLSGRKRITVNSSFENGIDITGLPTGTYTVDLQTSDGKRHSKKLMIAR